MRGLTLSGVNAWLRVAFSTCREGHELAGEHKARKLVDCDRPPVEAKLFNGSGRVPDLVDARSGLGDLNEDSHVFKAEAGDIEAGIRWPPSMPLCKGDVDLPEFDSNAFLGVAQRLHILRCPAGSLTLLGERDGVLEFFLRERAGFEAVVNATELIDGQQAPTGNLIAAFVAAPTPQSGAGAFQGS